MTDTINKPIIEFSNVTKRFGILTVLDQFNFSVAKGEKVTLPGFGTFETRERSAREGRNPQTGETMQIAASTAPAFKAGSALKKAVSGS